MRMLNSPFMLTFNLSESIGRRIVAVENLGESVRTFNTTGIPAKSLTGVRVKPVAFDGR